ncbi:MAG TPA: hypothetical protein VII06_04260 [Chloroflexota bacterium]|jgi:hypothetical protein
MSEPTPQEIEALQDPESWDWEHPERHEGRTTTVTEFCVRFAGPELRALAQAARQERLPIGTFIHRAALRAAGYAAGAEVDERPTAPPGARTSRPT